MNAKKETEGKLNHEFDWDFIDGMGKKMAENKGKYPPYNWMKELSDEDFNSLKHSIFRHWRKFIQPVEGDVETAEDHLFSIACNAMMVWYQLKIKNR